MLGLPFDPAPFLGLHSADLRLQPSCSGSESKVTVNYEQPGLLGASRADPRDGTLWDPTAVAAGSIHTSHSGSLWHFYESLMLLPLLT